MEIGDHYLYVDIQAEKTVNSLVILVEVKELQDVPSPVEALANAVGKYVLYRMALDSAGDHDIPLYVAITLAAYTGILSAEIGQKVVSITRMPLLVFDPYREEIVQWIP